MRIRGRVERVNEKGFCFVRPLEKLANDVVVDRGTLFAHFNNLGRDPSIGDEGDFEIGPGSRGTWVVNRVHSWTKLSTNESTTEINPTTSDSFIHPYNFVRLPSDDALQDALKSGVFKRSESATHARYDNDKNAGYVDCELTTRTHWFIPDPRKVHEDNHGHKTLGYFTLDDLSTWNRSQAGQDVSRPAIPGASLRGMVRSVFETLTLSCFSVFDADKLDFRIGYSPGHFVKDAPAQAEYLPCRIVETDGERASVQILNGKLPSDNGEPIVINSLLVGAYKNKVKEGKGSEDQWTNLGDALDGTPVAALINWTVSKDRRDRFRFRRAKPTVVIATREDWQKQLNEQNRLDIVAKLKTHFRSDFADRSQPSIIFGYLHRTGPNWREKKDERIFFDANAAYNNPKHPNAISGLAERLHAFFGDTGNRLPVDSIDFAISERALKEYSDRNGKKIKPAFAAVPRNVSFGDKQPLPSDFIQRKSSEVQIRKGDLYYALIDSRSGQQKVVGLFPVAIPRLTHEHSRGALLPVSCYPCGRQHEKCRNCRDLDANSGGLVELCEDCVSSHDRICPACRVFGWTRDLSYFRRETRQELRSKSDRVDAIAGHVRFTHGILQGDWGSGLRIATKQQLGILSSPKPTTTGFYLRPFSNWEDHKAKRFPPVAGLDNDDKNPMAATPVYHNDEATLRGRKFYRRRNRALFNPNQSRPSDQNQTVHVLPPELTFEFRIYFDNLTDEELGALLLSLSLDIPESWKPASQKGQRPFHALGHGKPFGMGQCNIQPTRLVIDSASRYDCKQFSGITNSDRTTDSEHDSVKRTFTDQVDSILSDDNIKSLYSEFIEMLINIPDGTSCRFPRVGNGQAAADFTWWQNAKKSGQLLPDPIVERENPDARLKQ